MTNEAFASIEIDQLLIDIGRLLTDGTSVRYNCLLNGNHLAEDALFVRAESGLVGYESKHMQMYRTAGCRCWHRVPHCSSGGDGRAVRSAQPGCEVREFQRGF